MLEIKESDSTLLEQVLDGLKGAVAKSGNGEPKIEKIWDERLGALANMFKSSDKIQLNLVMSMMAALPKGEKGLEMQAIYWLLIGIDFGARLFETRQLEAMMGASPEPEHGA